MSVGIAGLPSSDHVGHSVLIAPGHQYKYNSHICVYAANLSNCSFGSLPVMPSIREYPSSLVESCFRFQYGFKRFSLPHSFWTVEIPFYLRWHMLPFSYVRSSDVLLCRLAALQCIRSCIPRTSYIVMLRQSLSPSSRRLEVWLSLSSFCVRNTSSSFKSCSLCKYFDGAKKNPVPARLLLRASESGRPVGGRGAKTLTYTDLQQYILLSAVKDGSCYEYRFFNQVPFEDLSSFASHNNIVVAQVPLAKLVPFLTKRDAKSVLRVHGKSKLFREHDVHSDVVQSALHSHHCNACVSMVSVFTTVATASARSKAASKKYYAKQSTVVQVASSGADSDIPATGSEYPPPPPSDELSMRIIRDFCLDTSPAKFEEAGCAVCGLLSPLSTLKPLKSVENQLHVLELCGVTRSERLSAMDPVGDVSGPVLSKSCDQICDSCRSSVRDYKVPRNALATGLWVGDVPPVLSDLRFVERLLVAKVRHNVCFVKVASGQRKLISHAVAFESPVHKIYTKLPPPREDMDDVLAILFTGPVRPMKEQYLRTPLLVRHKAVVKALEWLKLNHQDYEDLEIDYELLRRDYPEDVPCVSVQYQETLCNKRPESTSVHDQEEEDGTEEGQCPFIVHGVTSEDLETKTTEQLKAVALRHFNSNGKILAVDGSSKTESIYRNPHLYPQMFPWLFPYGYGGVGTVSNRSEQAHIRHLLMYHDKRFQTDPCFPLVCFSHRLVKSSTTAGFLLAEKSKFEEIAERLISLDMDVLKSLSERLAAGEKVRPETDAEKLCYQLITDLDQINCRVDNSSTSKKSMRNEIWSLIAHLGLPSWFITFSPADSYHPICLYFADKRQKFSPALRGMDERIRLIASNPVAGARFFHFMVEMFIKHVLAVDKDHAGFFGDTAGYHGTVEQQGRLTLHLHLLLWISNALSPEEIKHRLMDADGTFQKKLIEYLESVHVGEFLTGKQEEVLAQMEKDKENGSFVDPSQTLPTPPPLGCSDPVSCDRACDACKNVRSWRSFFRKQVDYLLAQTNIHKCSSNLDEQGRQTSKRSWKGCLNNIWRRCKARFPRLIVLESFVDESGHLHLKKLEAWLNTITPLVTFLLRCNTDVTSLLSGTAVKGAILYITNYVTKPILKTCVIFDTIRRLCLSNPVILNSDPERHQKVRALMTKIVNNLSAKMEIGGPLASLYMLGFPDHYVSHRFASFYWQSFVHEVRSYWDKDIVAAVTPKVTVVKHRGRVVGLSPVFDYIYRPKELEHISLYDWISSCKRETLTKRKAPAPQSPEEVDQDLDDCEPSPSLPSLPVHNNGAEVPLGLFRFTSDHPLYDTHGIRVVAPRYRRIPNFLGASLPRRDQGDREYYCATMLTIFKPWRSGACLKLDGQSWDEAFNLSLSDFPASHTRVINNTHLRFECYDAQDDYHAQLRKGATSLPIGIPFDSDVLNDVDDALPDLNDSSYDQPVELGKRQTRWNNQMLDIRGILDRLRWCNPFAPTVSLPPPLPIEVNNTSQDWKHVVQNARQAILDMRERLPDPVQCTEPFIQGVQGVPPVEVFTSSKAHLEKKFHSKKDLNMISAISCDFELNLEQDRAFRIIANHACNPYSDQLKMYLGGMGGTGKSRVLHAVLEFFRQRNELYRCVVVAPTGTAAALLQGSTYHYMFGIDDKRDDISTARMGKVASRLDKVEYVFLDEVSMLSCKDMFTIGNRLCKVKNNLSLPFGGINMIFAGDFAQLPPPYGGENASLYSSTVGSNPSSYNSQIAALGKALWHQVTTVVILRQNMRVKEQTAEDAQFREALSNMRYKACTPDDISFLRTLVSGAKRHSQSVSDQQFRDVSIITSLNIHKDEINRLGSLRFAAETDQELHHFYSEDTISQLVPNSKPNSKYRNERVRKSLPLAVQRALWNQPASTNSCKIAGKLSLCYGMPILLRANIATELCITKGQEAMVHSWESTLGTHGLPVLETLFVSLVNPPATVNIPGLPVNVVPIPRSTVSVTCSLPDDSEICVSRSQVEVLPNYAMTDYSSQGKTRQYNVCDLNNSRTHQAYYTAISRSSSARGTVILQGFDQYKIMGGCSGALRQEYRELELLDDIVRLRYNSTLPANVYGDRRNTLLESFRLAMGKAYTPPHLHRSLEWSKDRPFSSYSDCAYAWNHRFEADGSSHLQLRGAVHQSGAQKRKIDVVDGVEPRNSKNLVPPSCPSTLTFVPCGPIWSNNSCAYDSLTAALYNIWQENPVQWHRFFCILSRRFLMPVSNVMNAEPFSVMLVNKVRDQLQTLMFQYNNVSYARGRYVSAVDLAAHILATDRAVCSAVTRCVNGHVPFRGQGHEVVSSAFVQIPLDDPPPTMQAWVDNMRTKTHRLCVVCQEPLNLVYSFDFAPPFLGFEVDNVNIVLSTSVQISTRSSSGRASYRLAAVIYYGAQHFCTRYISPSGSVYFHDGMLGSGMVTESRVVTGVNLANCRGKSVVFALYAIQIGS